MAWFWNRDQEGENIKKLLFIFASPSQGPAIICPPTESCTKEHDVLGNLHCIGYLSWPIARVAWSKPSHGSSLASHCFSFCLWWDDLLLWGRQELHRCLPSPCSDYTKAVCGPDPRRDRSWNYCQQCEQRQSHLPLYGQVPPHYLGDWLTRIPHVWAVKCLVMPAVW